MGSAKRDNVPNPKDPRLVVRLRVMGGATRYKPTHRVADQLPLS